MEIVEYSNEGDIKLNLPALPHGYSWKVCEEEEAKGVWIILVLSKRVAYGKITRKLLNYFGLSMSRDSIISSRNITYQHYSSDGIRFGETPDEIQQAFEKFAKRSYLEEFPKPLIIPSVYVGTYT